jgi:hypothetical protein
LQARLGAVGGNSLAIQIENLSDASFNGTLRLTPSDRLNLSGPRSIKLKPGETSKLMNF